MGRKWDPRTKATIVLQELKGRPVTDICIEHHISQVQYYQWRDKFVKKMSRVFVDTEHRQKSLVRENSHLKKMIGELTVELKTERVVRMKRQESKTVMGRNIPVVERIKEIKADHPF